MRRLARLLGCCLWPASLAQQGSWKVESSLTDPGATQKGRDALKLQHTPQPVMHWIQPVPAHAPVAWQLSPADALAPRQPFFPPTEPEPEPDRLPKSLEAYSFGDRAPPFARPKGRMRPETLSPVPEITTTLAPQGMTGWHMPTPGPPRYPAALLARPAGEAIPHIRADGSGATLQPYTHQGEVYQGILNRERALASRAPRQAAPLTQAERKQQQDRILAPLIRDTRRQCDGEELKLVGRLLTQQLAQAVTRMPGELAAFREEVSPAA